MDPYDPILDQPQVIEFDEAPGSLRSRLANQDLYFEADANSDLYDLCWPWADERYVRSIRMHIHDPVGEEMMTLVTRYYPGYQETILGNEGMIISKRITALLGSHYDRGAVWTLECQAEGDRLLRLDIEIDWGEPLTQRIVDGLLVAQDNPRRAQGIYKQRNADRTCVFGNPQGRPSAYEFDDEGRASLTYYVLVNGIVEVPLLLTVSDVGEQVAWSGFLALRDAEREFELSAKQWEQAVKTGRLWTSDPRLNRAVQHGRLECLRGAQRMRTGLAPASRRTTDAAALVDCYDVFDATASRNLLAHLRRLAEKGEGRLPAVVPVRPKDALTDPGDEVVDTNAAYLEALRRHLRRHPDADLLSKHMPAVALCADSLVRTRWTEDEAPADGLRSSALAVALSAASQLAAAAGDDANAARWESEAAQHDQNPRTSPPLSPLADSGGPQQWLAQSGWRCAPDAPCGFGEAADGIRLAGQAVWRVTGLEWHNDGVWVYPMREPELRWWALIDFPVGDKSVTLVWDGQTLFSTCAVQSDQPVTLCDTIRVLHAGEHDFALQFDMIPSGGPSGAGGDGTDEDSVRHFRPTFDQNVGK